MSVDSRTVQGRRQLTFRSFEDVVADAEMLVAAPRTKVLGNWPLPQLLMHLATAMNRSLDGITARAPWFMRLIGPFLKRRILEKGMSPGFKLPKDREAYAFPEAASAQEALETLRKAVSRVQSEKMTVRHPVFGKITHEEWARFHLRHAELHLSFAVAG